MTRTGYRRTETETDAADDVRAAISRPTQAGQAHNAAAAPPSETDVTLAVQVPRTNRRRRVQNILQRTAPDARRQIIEQNWTRDFIVDAQSNDTILSKVKEWLLAGRRPAATDLPPQPDLRSYFQQFDVLTMRDGLMYRTYFNTAGGILHYQLLIPDSMKTAVLELIHASVLCHAKMLFKNEKCLLLYAYWPTWRKSLRIFVAACRRCLEYHRGAAPKQ